MEELIDELFSNEGVLSELWEEYEERPSQKAMSQQIFNAYKQDKIALIEAGTGTGKSLAYLIPAVLWAHREKELTVISTHTISLQEQLLDKEIPFLKQIFDFDFQATLVKGMENYLCLRKLENPIEDLFRSDEEREEAKKVEEWAANTEKGCRSHLPFSVRSWSSYKAQSDNCTHVKCPQFKRCFYFKARKALDESQILIVNHHLLLSDILAKRRGDTGVLPHYERLVIDEAHHFEKIALEMFSQRSDRSHLLGLLSQFADDKKNSLSLSSQLLGKKNTDRNQIAALVDEKNHLDGATRSFFLKIETLIKERQSEHSDVEFYEDLFSLDERDSFKKEAEELGGDYERFIEELTLFSSDIEKGSSLKDELLQLIKKAEEQIEYFTEFFLEKGENRARWIEGKESRLTLVDVNLEIAKQLEENLFGKLSSAVLCSATLSISRSFQYVKDQLGLHERTLEGVYDSPFNYREVSMLGVVDDLPLPHERDFTMQACSFIEELLSITQGDSLILFTSYEMLDSFAKRLRKTAFPLLVQGEASRSKLAKRFIEEEGSVLLGTDSFWEGIDIPGTSLRSVVIVKLPFAVPTDPLVKAYGDMLTRRGKNPFSHYSLPQAVMKFKQGVGRLIRTKTDHGSVICLDKRLVQKSYGKSFLKSLPPMPQIIGSEKEILKKAESFFNWSVAESNR